MAQPDHTFLSLRPIHLGAAAATTSLLRGLAACTPSQRRKVVRACLADTLSTLATESGLASFRRALQAPRAWATAHRGLRVVEYRARAACFFEHSIWSFVSMVLDEDAPRPWVPVYQATHALSAAAYARATRVWEVDQPALARARGRDRQWNAHPTEDELGALVRCRELRKVADSVSLMGTGDRDAQAVGDEAVRRWEDREGTILVSDLLRSDLTLSLPGIERSRTP